MTADYFLDTNLFLYAFSSAAEDERKREICEKLVTGKGVGISAQVLQEFISNALKKSSLGVSEEGIDTMLKISADLQVAPVTHELVIRAVNLRRQYQLSHWDSTILAAAEGMGCLVLYSEDFSHGQSFGAVRVINPFR